MSSRTVIEAVAVELGAARSRESQHYCSAGEGSWSFGKGKDAEGTWRYESVIVDEASIGLVIGECCAVGVWGCGAVDDGCGVTIESVGWRIEGIEEVVGEAGARYVESWSLEGIWKIGQRAIEVELMEE